MEKYRPGITLKEAIKEAQETREVFDIEDPFERAAAIADWVRREYPFAWQLETMQNEAARAVGVPTFKQLAKEAEAIEESKRIRGQGWEEELNRLGLSLLAVSGLFVLGGLYSGAIGSAILGCALIGLGKSLDKPK